MRTSRTRLEGLMLVVAGLAAMVLLSGLGGCVSAEARAREEDWTGRAMRAAHAADDGRAQESADLLTQLWKEKAVSPQPEGGIPPGKLAFGTAVVLKNEQVRSLLEPELRKQLAGLEQKILEGNADEHETEVWYDLVGSLDAMDSLARVVEAGRTNRAIIKPLLSPSNQRLAVQRVLRSNGLESTAKVLDLTDGEAFAQGAGDVLRFANHFTPALLATH